MSPGAKKYNPSERKDRILHYCAYRERNHQEVKQKLLSMGASYQEADELIVELIQHNYLNEERYARAFCRGKFLHNKWGKVKIVQYLKRNGISNYCIKKGLEEIDHDEYQNLLISLLQEQFNKRKGLNIFKRRDQVAKALIQKGFEAELVWGELKKMEE